MASLLDRVFFYDLDEQVYVIDDIDGSFVHTKELGWKDKSLAVVIPKEYRNKTYTVQKEFLNRDVWSELIDEKEK